MLCSYLHVMLLLRKCVAVERRCCWVESDMLFKLNVASKMLCCCSEIVLLYC